MRSSRFLLSRPASKSGLTLIELLVSVVILTVGIVVIQRALLSSVMALSYVNGRSEASRLVSEKIWEIQEQSLREGRIRQTVEKGILMGESKTYEYEMTAKTLEPLHRLYEIELTASWPQSWQRKALTRAFYVLTSREMLEK